MAKPPCGGGSVAGRAIITLFGRGPFDGTVRVRATVRFHGRVQGVYFRTHCEEQARSLRLEGYVRNVPDGSVEAVFEGERALVEQCIEWNRSSQPAAQVTRMHIDWGTATGEYHGFEIRR